MKVFRQSAPLPPPVLARRVFDGEILAFHAGARAAAGLARDIAKRAFAPEHPPHAHRVFARDEFLRRARTAQMEFENHPDAPGVFAAAVESAGIPRARIFLDCPRLRIAPPVATHSGGVASHVGPHRDTWGVGVQAQINWWSPVWPVSRRRTLAFFPGYFRRPLENTTAGWSFAAYNAARKSAPPGRAPDYPAAPVPLAAPDESPVPATPSPGELLCFSAAHLHASVPNTANLTRFSIEIRSVNPDDIRAGRGAPNADCATPKMIWGLFRAPKDGAPVSRFL